MHYRLVGKFVVSFVGLILACSANLRAEDPTEAAVKDPEAFFKKTAQELKWSEPAEPLKVVGPIHFVGTQGLSVWLITSPRGHILLNSGMPGSGPLIEKSIRKLGFKPEDVKYLLTCHAHVDHVGGHAYLKKVTGAKVVVLKEEVELIESGGRKDFHYAKVPIFAFDPVKVDQAIENAETVKIGDLFLTPMHTPGHTRGSTTWVMNVTAEGKQYNVVFPDGTSVNPGYRLVVNPSYAGIADDFQKTFDTLGKIRADIWLRPHTDTLKLDLRRETSKKEGAKAWVDREGYVKWVEAQRAKYELQLVKERQSAK